MWILHWRNWLSEPLSITTRRLSTLHSRADWSSCSNLTIQHLIVNFSIGWHFGSNIVLLYMIKLICPKRRKLVYLQQSLKDDSAKNVIPEGWWVPRQWNVFKNIIIVGAWSTKHMFINNWSPKSQGQYRQGTPLFTRCVATISAYSQGHGQGTVNFFYHLTYRDEPGSRQCLSGRRQARVLLMFPTTLSYWNSWKTRHMQMHHRNTWISKEMI